MRQIIATDNEAVEPGIYVGTLKSVTEGTGKFGDYYDWEFTVPGPDGQTAYVDRRTSAKFGPQTIARSYVNALLGRQVMKGEAIDLDALIGKTARLKVVTNENGFSTIEAIAPAQGGAAPAAPAAASSAPTDDQILAAAGAGSEFENSDVPF
jgi:hypothetical protein